MRYGIHLLVVLVAVGFVLIVSWLVRTGNELRVAEIEAQAALAEILQAQYAAVRDPSSGGTYLSLKELVEREALRGFEVVDDESGSAIHQRGEYLFQVTLRPPALEDGARAGLGARFEAWAWPANPERRTAVLLWTSNAGFLLQGENGVAAGPGRLPPAGSNPLREMTRAAAIEGMKSRWIVLADRSGDLPTVAPDAQSSPPRDNPIDQK